MDKDSKHTLLKKGGGEESFLQYHNPVTNCLHTYRSTMLTIQVFARTRFQFKPRQSTNATGESLNVQ